MHCTYRYAKRLTQTTWFSALILVGQIACGAERNKTPVASIDSSAESLSKAFRAAANQASPGLVTVYSLRGPRMTDQWRRREAERNGPADSYLPRELRDEQGSGIVIDRQGLILTCNHVVDFAEVVFVVLSDGRKYEAVDIRGDPDTDLAVIRIEGAGEIDEVELGDSDGLQVGDWVVSLGNPYDLERSVSAGIVSATDRWVPGTHHPLIQNDAATNPGSSGGALLNLKGEVMGILTGGFSTDKEFQGIGLAIPVNTAKQVVAELANPQPSQRAYLGCETQKLSAAIAEQLELPVAGGLYVKDVEKGSPAARAGIERGDVITHFAAQSIDDTFRPALLLDETIPGNTYSFTFFRDGHSQDVDVQMCQSPSRHDFTTTPTKVRSISSAEQLEDFLLGLSVEKFTSQQARLLDLPQELKGVLVTDVARGSHAYKEGIAAGMVILRINSHEIQELSDYRQSISTCPKMKPVLMLIQSNKGRHLVVLNR